MRKKAILSNCLYVDEKYVTQDMLDSFSHTIENYYAVGDNINADDLPDDGSLDLVIKGYVHRTAKRQYGFYTGRRRLVKKYFSDFDIDDRRSNVPMSEYARNHLRFNEDFRLTEMQKPLVETFLRKGYGILKAPARSGKTVVMGSIVVRMKKKTLILADRSELLKQWKSEFSKVSNIDDIDNDRHSIIGFLSTWEDVDKYDIVLSTWQKWNRNKKKLLKYRSSFGLILVDEIHKCNAECPKEVVSQFAARYKGGVTATVIRKDGRHEYMKFIVGPVIAEAKPEQMHCVVQTVLTGLDCWNGMNWGKVITSISKNKIRNRLILRYIINAANKGRHILVGAERVGHIKALVTALNDHGVPAEGFYGKSPTRKGMMKRASSGESRVVVAMRQMILGINVPEWDTYFNILPVANPPTYYQQYSRIRTKCKNKLEPTIYDFVDEGNGAWGCYNIRRTQYDKEGFSFMRSEKPIRSASLGSSNLLEDHAVHTWNKTVAFRNRMLNHKESSVDGKSVASLFSTTSSKR